MDFNKSIDKTVTYQPSCHMTNIQKVKTPPLQLLKSIPGLKLKELDRPDFCCGSAGIYNIINYEDSMDILDVKMKDVCGTDSGSVVTTNPGCLLQMKLGIEREGVQPTLDAAHLVDLLLEADPQQK